jgi:hypothetical protein
MSQIKKGATDVTIYFKLVDPTTGVPETGLTITDLDMSYTRERSAISKTDATALGGVSVAHSDNSMIEVSATNAPGVYRADWPDAAFATGVNLVILTINGTAIDPTSMEIELVDNVASDIYTRLGTPNDTDIATDIENVQTGVDLIQTVGSAQHEPVVAAPNGFTLTTGINEQNDEDSTQARDGVTHSWDSTGNAMDGRYTFDTGGAYSPVNLFIRGRLSGSVNDSVLIQVNTGTVAAPVWVTRGSMVRTVSATLINHDYPLFNGDVMTGADAGKVQVRIVNDGAVTGASMIIDQMYVDKTFQGSTVGYADGAIWVDTNSGNTGTVPDYDGTADRPVTWAAAITLSGSKNIKRFRIINGSSITLSGDSSNYSLIGQNWTLALGGQTITNMYVEGATSVTGIGTGTTPEFISCTFGNVTLPPHRSFDCVYNNTLTYGSAGDFKIIDGRSGVAGAGAPVTDCGAAIGASTFEYRDWDGGHTFNNLASGDIGTLGGTLGTVTLNGADASVEIRGTYKGLTNNLTGAPTVNTDGATRGKELNDIYVKLPSKSYLTATNNSDGDIEADEMTGEVPATISSAAISEIANQVSQEAWSALLTQKLIIFG